VPNQATARAFESDIVSRLARFFPDAIAVRIPIKLSRSHGHGNGNGHGEGHGNGNAPKPKAMFFQDTVIEYGTPREVLFVVERPLEFADHVLVESHDGSLCVEALVVAVQCHLERTAIAVRFLKPVSNWIVKS